MKTDKEWLAERDKYAMESAIAMHEKRRVDAVVALLDGQCCYAAGVHAIVTREFRTVRSV